MDVVTLSIVCSFYVAFVGFSVAMCSLARWFWPQPNEQDIQLRQALISKVGSTEGTRPKENPASAKVGRKITFHDPVVTTIVEIDVETGEVVSVAI